MTKILAKTNGPTLVALSGEFLDSYKYRIIEFDNRVRDWNNRNLLDVKAFFENEIDPSELDSLGVDNFLAKYKKDENVVEEKIEEVKEEVEEQAEEVKEEPQPKRKKARR